MMHNNFLEKEKYLNRIRAVFKNGRTCDNTFLWWNMVKVNGTVMLEGGEEERAQKRGIGPSSHVVKVRVALLAAEHSVALPTS